MEVFQMSNVFNSKRVIVMSAVVSLLLLVQIESFAGQDWEVITQLPTQRSGIATAVVDDRIYIIGGTLENVGDPDGVSTVEEYDPQTNTWRRVADMPTRRYYPKAAVVNDTIYVFGGWYEEKGVKTEYPVRLDAYDPATDTWTRKKDMPVPRVHPAVGAVDGKIYIIGGSTGWGWGDERRMDRVDIYDPATNTWEDGPKMPTQRDAYLGGVVNNRIYVIGGYGPPGGQVLSAIEEYDPINRQWQKKKDMLNVKFSFRTAVVKDDIYVIGGIDKSRQYLATVDMYNPQTETWRDIPAIPTPMYPQGAATVNGTIYVFGGMGAGGQFLPDVLAFDTGFRAVEANGKLLTRWGQLKKGDN
ncbi:hypothetical protein C6503_19005 [Candidatus Poribacteria bacterium]|nr:MAG: hypothetical protein C6503_19005 [Candidatus Poribacteria bacterium]